MMRQKVRERAALQHCSFGVCVYVVVCAATKKTHTHRDFNKLHFDIEATEKIPYENCRNFDMNIQQTGYVCI